MATFNVQGKVINKATKLPVPMANVKLYEVDKVAAGYKSDFLTEGLTGLDGKFNVTFAWPYDVSIPTNRPDIILIFSLIKRRLTKQIHPLRRQLH